ncbi:(2Fe-2S)-binding protein [Roseovarius mucosus]|uniref:(2Fe-2S)-binding protein n=1 Tax=Roseovarius mucosus TaxID=215743 RepID=UPI001C5CC89E|nr:(2Fe-2S)-binding protein [Roseovarius mucosus]MBW4973706.1 (2Fe-2S)-binding protein [Roseovarius mucosus]
MIICHCMAITDADIHSAMDWMRAADAETLITPGKIYRALGKRADCGGCLPLFVDTMRQADSLSIPMHLRGLRRASTQGEPHEGRRQGHRLSQSGSAE